MNWQGLLPAFYQLGLLRVQYFQKRCCVCHINPIITLQRRSNKERFFDLICEACHDEIQWLPQPILQEIQSSYTSQSNLSQSVRPPLASSSILSQNTLIQSLDTRITTDFSPFKIQSAAPHLYYIRAAIIAFKYKEQLNALLILIHAIRQLPRPLGCYAKNSVILPTPTTRNRLATRGFDPMTTLAYYLSQHWEIPLWQGATRIDDVLRQQGLDRVERQQNIHDAFRITSQPPSKRVLIFDDVVTTGSTLSALAHTLKSAYPDTKISAYCISHGK